MTDISSLMGKLDYGASPEEDSHARAWLKKHGGRFGQFIGGAFTKPGAALFPVINPANGEKLADVTRGGKADVDAAVAAAGKAFKSWSALSGSQRARHLYALARHIQKHSRLLAVLETMDNGKPIRETRDLDVPLAVRHFYHHAGWAELRDTAFPGQGPAGVCGQIIPWNFPR